MTVGYMRAQSCPTLYHPMDYSPLRSSGHGIFQARILECVSIFFSRGFSCPRDRIHVSCTSCIGRQIFLPLSHLGNPQNDCTMLSHFSHVWLFETPWTVTLQAPLPMEIFQARILDWISMPSSRGSSQPRYQTHVSYVSCIGRQALYH